MNDSNSQYEALLFVSFGGPEKMDDVIPFLENVLRGRNVPRERMMEVAHHYEQFDGKSPINDQIRDLIDAVEKEISKREINLPHYWGNRNWHPMLTDTLQEMTEKGVKKALAFVVSAYSCYSGCRQYREDIMKSQEEVGENGPEVHKIRVFYNHPKFIQSNADRIKDAIAELPESEQGKCHISFTAHSIPSSMADGCDYEVQLNETARLICEQLGIDASRRSMVYQSRSGRPQDPWLEPDICDHLKEIHKEGKSSVVVAPIGFLSDHMEVMFDLDVEAKDVCEEIGLPMSRAKSVGTHPVFVEMIVDLIEERMTPEQCEVQSIGERGPNPHFCKQGCCPAPKRPAGRPQPAK